MFSVFTQKVRHGTEVKQINMLKKWLIPGISKLKLRHKLAVSYTLTFTLLVGITFISIYYIAEKNREDEFYQRLKDKSITTFSILIKVEQIDHDMLLCSTEIRSIACTRKRR